MTQQLRILTHFEAFLKTDRLPTGQITKKTSEWVLADFALNGGLTPTTRYRVKKETTFRSNNPAPNRVRSGRAGGLSTALKTHSKNPKNYAQRPSQALLNTAGA